VDDLTTNSEPSPQPVPEPTQHDFHWIFIGKTGIRAGWGIALFIIIFIVSAIGVSVLARYVLHPPRNLGNTPMPPHIGILLEGLQVLCVLIATAALALIERKSLFAYGYQGSARTVRFVSGLVWGFIAISVLVLVLWKSGLLVFDGRLLHGITIWRDAILWGLVFLGTGIFEESLLRGYIQFTMTRGVGFWWGALIFSLLFGFGHTTNPGESPVGLFSAGAAGLLFCISLWYTGSLWWAVGFHAAWDWGQSYFYGTADSGLITRGHLLSEHPTGKLLWSGGATGPEGSLLIIPLLILVALCMWLWWGRRVQSPFTGSGWRPAWSRTPRTIDTPGIAAGPAGATS
jgi:uncharacterized protein